MQETMTVISFSTEQLGLMLGMGLLLLLLPLLLVKLLGSAFAPVYKIPQRQSGIGGLLLLTVGVVLAESLYALYHFGQGMSEVIRLVDMDRHFLWPALQTLIPDLATALFLFLSAGILTCQRSAGALYMATGLLWLGGPFTAVLRHYYLGIPLAVDSEPTASFLLTCVLTLYLLCSDRTALTYGTSAGVRLYERRAKQ